MHKRRRTSSVASRGTEDDPEEVIPEPTKRRKKLDPSDLCQQLYDIIRNQKKEDGTLLCDAFIRVPKRRQEPGYYEVVTNPIDLLKVQQKLKTDEYRDMEDLAADVHLMITNAKAFYSRTSPEFRDATDLWELCVNTKNRIMDEYEETEPKGKIILKVGRLSRKTNVKQPDDAEDTSESSTNPDEETMQPYEDLFTTVMTATDPTDNNRVLHTVFQLKPSKKLYPEYYDVIENPIDLKTIARRIQEGTYSYLSEMERDLMLMCRNACQFNEPGSQIYKDAKILKKIITAAAKKQDSGSSSVFSNKLATPSTRSSKRGNRSFAQSLIAQTATLLDEDEESDDEDDETAEIEEADNAQWQLFQTIRTAPTNQGVRMSEFFWKLPSRRMYPDYYKMIKNPISLLQIRSKIKKGEYGTVSEVAGDMNIMFENAKKYNVHTSRLYKCAVKLQKIMQEKVQELLEFDQDSDSDCGSESNSQTKLIKRASNVLTRGKYKDNIPLKKRLYALVKCVIEYVCEDGRQPMLMFMEKPSKKIYPDYYQVINDPIDMLAIEANIKAEKYQNENELIQDFKLMFNNCRQYNEEGSLIYEDANTLEKVLMDKVRELGPLPDSKSCGPIKSATSTPTRNVGRPKKVVPLHLQKLRTMYDTIKDYHDSKGRQLSLIFMKLPNKNEYPDYYEVIKQPINMEKIASTLKTNGYESLEELVSDFILMFDNACKYNEPDSQIYKDALILQRLVLQTKLQLSEDDENVPDVPAAIQEILATIFTALYNHQDEEGRCYSDSMSELPEHDIIDGKKIRGLSLDLIKRRLDRGVYKRLDRFQEDVFTCLERARKLSRSDSQPFEDSVELQAFFLRTRDEVTRNGDLLHSPALNYTLMDLSTQVAELKRLKHQQESNLSPEEESCDGNETKESGSSPVASGNGSENGGAMSFNQEIYRNGDFAYIEPVERGMEPSVVLIEKLWTNSEGIQMLYGNLFYRPSETYHVASRKFIDKELFKSDAHIAVPLSKVAGRCCVLSVKDFFRMQPEGFLEKDVYVCESRYSTRARAFKKIKLWNFDADHLKLVSREKTLEPKRNISVYKERLEKHKEEIAELEEGEKLTEKEKPNVILFNSDDSDNTYYEQYNMCTGIVKTGDFVYVATDGGRQQIAQVDSVWSTKDGKCYFRGPWLLTPSEIPHAPTKLFYKQELFLSVTDATHPFVAIMGRCAVLEYGEYVCCRPTEITEDDVFICESIYDETKNFIKKLPQDGLKKYTHTSVVTQDEIYFFRRPINPAKVSSDVAQTHLPIKSVTSSTAHFEMDASPLLPKLEPEVLGIGVGEDSMDASGPLSVGSTEAQPVLANTQTPVSTKKKTTGKKLVTGYILYSSKMRTQITQNNPDSTFGEISRIVGNEWRKLPAGEKQVWEERAMKMNEGAESRALALSIGAPVDQVFECCWDNCDWQFEDMTDCIDHCIAEQNGHVQSSFINAPADVEFQCQWRGCGRTKKNVPPFPSVQRLARHVKEVHILKGNGRIIPPSERSKNYMASKGPTILPPMDNEILATATQTTTAAPVSKQPDPIFIAVPPRPSRVLHSDAYLRYIEGLNVENRYISNWDKQMNATPENTQIPDVTKLPAEWLGNGVGNHGNVVNALWTLRNMMMRDVLAINKTL